MYDKRNIATYFLSASLFCLAGAMIYFTIGLTRVTQQIPTILSSVEQTGKKVEPVVKEISEIRVQIPPIIAEVQQVREQIPPILDEVRQVREQIPPILAEVKQVREQIPPILDEVRKTRPVVTKTLDEVVKTREAIPPMLAKADKIVTEARQLGQKTSEGAVTGVITGIFKAPFKIVGGIGKSIFAPFGKEAQKLTQADRELSIKTVNELVTTGKLGESRKWANPASGNEGVVTFKEEATLDERQCRIFHFVIRIQGKERIKRDVTLCLNDESEWEMREQ